jgi:hypothetical protein
VSSYISSSGVACTGARSLLLLRRVSGSISCHFGSVTQETPATPVWLVDAIDSWVEGWDRRPGRRAPHEEHDLAEEEL